MFMPSARIVRWPLLIAKKPTVMPKYSMNLLQMQQSSALGSPSPDLEPSFQRLCILCDVWYLFVIFLGYLRSAIHVSE